MKINNKKAQVKMFESVAVLIVFFFLLSFGFTFYGKMQSISNEKKIKKSTELDAVSLAIQVSNLPELQCSTKNIATPNCYDELKLMKVKNILRGNDPSLRNFLTDHYYQVLGNSKVELIILYPNADSNSYTDSNALYDFPLAEYESAIDKPGMVNYIPMSIYNPIDKTYNFGYLKVTYYTP